MHGDDDAYYTVPDSARAVAQLLLLYEMGGGEILKSMVTRDFSKAQISVRVKAVGTAEFERLMNLTEAYIAEHAPPGVSGYVTGTPAIYTQISHKIVHSQIVSLFTSFAAVGAIVAVLMGSWVAGLISLTPLAFSVGSSFGIMAYAGATLDMATVMLASLVIGIGVDYGVHFISRYRRERLGGLEHKGAFLTAFQTAGRGHRLQCRHPHAGVLGAPPFQLWGAADLRLAHRHHHGHERPGRAARGPGRAGACRAQVPHPQGDGGMGTGDPLAPNRVGDL